MTPKLEVNGVDFSYHTLEGETKALSDISFHVNSGEFLCIVGPSGCGKSTLLSLLSGLLAPERGEILLDGIPVAKGSSGIGYMLQRDHLFPWLTVRENALVGIRVRQRPTAAQRAQVERLLKACGLTGFADALPGQLSGGMRQRAALVRTLAVDPDLLLLDAPFSALDAQPRIQLSDEVKQRLGEGRATILVTHDVSEAISMADRVVVLTRRPARIRSVHDITLAGTPMQRRGDPAFREYFEAIWKELDVHVQ